MAYQKTYKCDYDTAWKNSYKIMAYYGVKEEIKRLKDLKNKSIMIDGYDVLERHMRIAFSDMTDFVEWGNQESTEINSISGEEYTRNINMVKFKDSNTVDGGLICKIKQGKDGAEIKLEDRQKSLDWLSKYFEMNPMDNHRKDFDTKKLKHDKYVSSEKLKIDREKLTIEKEKVDKGINDTSINLTGIDEIIKAKLGVKND